MLIHFRIVDVDLEDDPLRTVTWSTVPVQNEIVNVGATQYRVDSREWFTDITEAVTIWLEEV